MNGDGRFFILADLLPFVCPNSSILPICDPLSREWNEYKRKGWDRDERRRSPAFASLARYDRISYETD
jgi:hypothetical protein